MILYNQFDRACFASFTAYVLLLSSHVNCYDGEAEKEEDEKEEEEDDDETTVKHYKARRYPSIILPAMEEPPFKNWKFNEQKLDFIGISSSKFEVSSPSRF